MKLPAVDNADAYTGLYVYDFGEWSAVGYTAEEIAILLEDAETRGGTIYRIQRATPDGGFELRGVSAERFQLESGMFFFRGDRAQAEQDFAALVELGERAAPPCRAVVRLAERPDADAATRFVVGLIYPAEYDEDMSRWLLAANYAGGDLVEGGISLVTDFQRQPHAILERAQLWPSKSRLAREAEEVLRTTREAVQR